MLSSAFHLCVAQEERSKRQEGVFSGFSLHWSTHAAKFSWMWIIHAGRENMPRRPGHFSGSLYIHVTPTLSSSRTLVWTLSTYGIKNQLEEGKAMTEGLWFMSKLGKKFNWMLPFHCRMKKITVGKIWWKKFVFLSPLHAWRQRMEKGNPLSWINFRFMYVCTVINPSTDLKILISL